MIRIAFFLTLAFFCDTASAQSSRANVIGASSPYTLSVGIGELAAQVSANWYDASGRTYKSVSSPASTWAVVVTVGQSLGANASLGTYSTVSANNWNFNLADRGVYNCANPSLGTGLYPNLSPSGNSINCQIGDGLISGGTYSNVIMVPAAVGGALCSDWNTGGSLAQRIKTLYNGLAMRGLTKASGFPGDVWILWHQGEQDNANGTAQATLTTCYQQVFALFSAAGFGTTRIFVATESLNANATSTAITNAQASVVASGCSQCRAGMNVDSFTGATYRQADGTHPTAALAAAIASGDVSVIQNCKSTSC
jgi:hypothetical protein